MHLADLLGLIEVSAEPVAILRPILDRCGLVAVERHESSASAGGSLKGQALTIGALVGRLQGGVMEALSDGYCDADERRDLLDDVDALTEQLQALRAHLVTQHDEPAIRSVPRG